MSAMPSSRPIAIGRPRPALLGLAVLALLGWLAPGRARAARPITLQYGTDPRSASSSFSEQFDFNARLRGGGSAYVRLLITNIAGADGRAELRASVILPDKRHVASYVRMKGGRWHHARRGVDIHLGTSEFTFRQTPRGSIAHVLVQDAHATMDFRLTSALPVLRPAGGAVVEPGGRYYATESLMPRAHLTGTIRIPADHSPTGHRHDIDPPGHDKIIALRGTASLEHRVGNIAPYDLAARWYSLHDLGGRRTVLLSSFERPGHPGRAHGWLVVANDHQVLAYAPRIRLHARARRRDPKTGYEVPHTLVIQGEGGLVAAVKATKATGRVDDLGGLNAVERFIVQRLMRPWTFSFNAQYLIKAPARAAGGRALPGGSFRGEAGYQYQQIH